MSHAASNPNQTQTVTALKHVGDILERHGFATVAAIFLFGVVFGFIPSPLMQNQKILTANQKILLEHQEEAQIAAQSQIELGRAACVNEALREGDVLAGNICNTSGWRQGELIERALKKAQGKKHE